MTVDPARSGPATDRLPQPAPDAVLVARAVEGDRDAFEQIYRRHAASVHGLCLRLAGDSERAEGLTQDTFVKAWLALGGYGGQAPLGAWLGRIAVNRWRDLWRTDKRAQQWLVDTGGEDTWDQAAAVAAAGRLEGAGSLLAVVDLERMIARLPAGARTVFVLHEVEGYPQAEVAALLGVSEGTIKSQMHRARRLLRAMFTETGMVRHEA